MSYTGYNWVRPVIDAPGTTLVPLEPLVEHFGVPCSAVELLVQLTYAREVADYLSGARLIPPPSVSWFRRSLTGCVR